MIENENKELNKASNNYKNSIKLREKMVEADLDFINFCTSQSLRHQVLTYDIMKKSPYFIKTEESELKQKNLVEAIENLVNEDPLYFVVFANNLKNYDMEAYSRCREIALESYVSFACQGETFKNDICTLALSELNEKQTSCFKTLYAKDNPGRGDFIKDMQRFAPERLKFLEIDDEEIG